MWATIIIHKTPLTLNGLGTHLGQEGITHLSQPLLKPCPIVWGLDGAFGRFGDPLHVFTERPSAARACRQTADGLKRAEHA